MPSVKVLKVLTGAALVGIILLILAWVWEIYPSRVFLFLFSPILKGISTVGGGLRKEIEHYLWLTRVRQENERLLRENEALKSRLVELQDQLTLCKAFQEEKKALFRRYPRVVARVIYHPLSPFEGLLVIDKGEGDGVFPEMPVVSLAEGEPGVLVGQVVETSEHYARVLPLTHPQSAIDVYGLRSKERGILKGRGTGQPLLLDYVPYGTDFRVGDLLVTSGLDALFPRNIRVGRVVRILPQKRQGFFQTIEVKPLVDLRRLSFVAVLIKPSVKKELSP